jgi:two-component system chemotaxis sensor kinase CheA
MPVVLVTALETREDKERGILVGANAYVLKSSFDQSNLLQIVGRLV